MESKVYIINTENTVYSKDKPYHPSEDYPEYLFDKTYISTEENKVYHDLRNLFHGMELDSDNFGLPEWNPFGSFIKPGDHVLIKPNMVRHFHPMGYTMDCLITNGSLIRAVIDFVIIALKGIGKITIGDAPIQSAIFDEIKKKNGLDQIVEFYKSQKSTIKFEIIDFRQTVALCDKKGRIVKTTSQENCEFKYVDIEDNSFFSNLTNKKYAIADYPYSAMKNYHTIGKHKYLVPQTLLDANVIINLPKPKTHRFAGLTGSMKNFIGVNSQKENLPHHCVGSLAENGDEYPSKSYVKKSITSLTNLITILATKNLYVLSYPLYIIRHLLIRLLRKNEMIFKGSWHGNDTIWRTILDVNRIVVYADRTGSIMDTQQRTVFTICDAIITGEYQGPLEPNPVKSKAIIAGFNLYAIDRFLAAFMGFKFECLPFLQNCPEDLGKIQDEELQIFSNQNEWNSTKLKDYKSTFTYTPAPGWETISNKHISL